MKLTWQFIGIVVSELTMLRITATRVLMRATE
jgi:hypothetical protein